MRSDQGTKTAYQHNFGTGFEPAALRRDPSADVLRGLGVLAVILYHSYFIATSTKSIAHLAIDTSDLMDVFIKTFEPARMPSMMFIAGFFAWASLDRVPSLVFIERKIRSVLYPFLMWSLAYLSFKTTNSIFRGSLNTEEFFEHVMHPAAHMWFLGYIFIYFLLLAAFWRWKWMLLACAVGGMVFAEITDWKDLNKALFLLCFFTLGATLPRSAMRHIGNLELNIKAILCAGMFLAVMLVVTGGLYRAKFDLQAIPVSAMAVIGMVMLAGIISMIGGSIGEMMKYIGKMSLEVYLIHWIVINMICVSLPDILKRQQPDLVVLLVFALGVGITVMVAQAAKIAGLRFLFVCPGQVLSTRGQADPAKSSSPASRDLMVGVKDAPSAPTH